MLGRQCRLLAVLAASLVAVMFAATAAFAETGGVLDIAHRGSSGAAPENTLAAVQLALDQRAGMVEVDVQRTADDELILMHDATLERTTDAETAFPDRAPWRVGDFTLAELRTLDAGSWFAPEYAGEPVPTLAEVLTAIGQRAGLLLEVKDPDVHPGLEADVAKELAGHPEYLQQALAAGNLVVQSFDQAAMRRFAERMPEVPIGLLFPERPTEAELRAASGWVEHINPLHSEVTESLVEAVHEHDMAINVYTVNDADLMRRYREMGVDGVITDVPVKLAEVVRGER